MTEAEKALLDAVLADIRQNPDDWQGALVEASRRVSEERCPVEVQQAVLAEEMKLRNARRQYQEALRLLEAKFSEDAVEVALIKARESLR